MARPQGILEGVAAWAVLLLVVIRGCEGSGSSGFDHVRFEQEPVVMVGVDGKEWASVV